MPIRLKDSRRPPHEGGNPHNVVVFLHGYGADGRDLLDLAQMWEHDLPHTLFAAPDAPFPCEMNPMGRQWFGLRDFSMPAVLQGAREAAPHLDAYLDGLLQETGLPAGKLALVGFSQGTMMALHVGLRRRERLAGIVGYSGLLPGPDVLAAEVASRPPVVLVHGALDDVVPVAGSLMANEVLEAAGVPVGLHVSPGIAHSIAGDGLDWGGEALEGWLAGEG